MLHHLVSHRCPQQDAEEKSRNTGRLWCPHLSADERWMLDAFFTGYGIQPSQRRAGAPRKTRHH